MKYAMIYSSQTGNTKKIADAIYETLKQETWIYQGQPKTAEEAKKADLIFVGFWTDKGTCDENTLQFLRTLHHKKIALFGTAGFGESEEYFHTVLQRIISNLPETSRVINTFMCQGKMPYAVRQRYEKALTEHPDDEKMKLLIDNFDRALSHPDENDRRNTEIFALKTIQILLSAPGE